MGDLISINPVRGSRAIHAANRPGPAPRAL